ncbi:hypothetical protein [Arenibaculum pallidiluteum]|uniref:hypothetical protein n=1 Tax=Arenibaculum pallidiluteum TaxID=2812559 RepID=UPI001A96D30E|nr:hypothetical protein [Arenibaculum pallidiluteum]
MARSRSSMSASGGFAGRLLLILLILVLLALVGAGAFLATWDIPAPSAGTEKTIPDDRFPR